CAGSGENRPALRDGIDLAFGVGRRSERPAVVKISAAVPLAVPGVQLDVGTKLARLGCVLFSYADVAARSSERGKLHKDIVEKERQPDALAFALCAHQVHAVVPVAGAHERQAMLAEAQPVIDRANAMFIKRAGLLG